MAENPEPFAKPNFEARPVTLEPGNGTHADVYAGFLDAIERGQPPVADGSEGRLSLELANALIYSGVTNAPVNLPLDRGAYHELLEKLRAGATSRLTAAS
jgi:predicted dehydrogenase